VTADDGITPSTPLQRLFRVRYEFSDEWAELRNALARGAATLRLPIDVERFPFLFRGAPIAIASVKLFATATDKLPAFDVTVTPPSGDPATITLAPSPADATFLTPNTGWPASPGGSVTVANGAAASWSIAVPAGSPLARARDLFALVTYTAKLPAVPA
jgi:hypothetical protein